MTITAGELIFIDTNILLSATDSSRKNHDEARKLLRVIPEAGFNPIFCGQVIREYLVVATRPVEANGFGMSAGDAIHNIKQFQKRIVVYEEKRSSTEILQHLVIKHQLNGKRIHDANIAAVMITNGIKYILTDNPSDFSCFEDITAVSCMEAVKIF